VPLRHWLQLSLTDGLGPILTARLIAACGSAQAACGASAQLLQTIDGIGQAKAGRIAAALRAAAGLVDDELAKAERAGARVLCRDDDEYPPLLREIHDPPLVLYCRGDVQPRDLHAVAIVGSRKCSFYGREQAERFAALMAGAGVTVTSGGARGIDSAAHRGAMGVPGGRTIAVLGSGIDVVYPPENKGLFDDIAARGGAVLSEYPMGTPPKQENFPRRNRVVSGMSRGVLVIEADERSGALITARQAIEDHDRIVFALPGRVDVPTSQGPHKLIREGAVLVRGLDDILEELGPLPDAVRVGWAGATGEAAADVAGTGATSTEPVAAPPASAPAPNLTDRQQAILAQFDGQPLGVDQLVERSGFAAHEVMQELTLLSLRGQLKRVDGSTYVRRRGPS